MVWDAWRGCDDSEKPRRHSLGVLVTTAIGTSIDAMAVGVTLALINASIIVTALAIGGATFTMVTVDSSSAASAARNSVELPRRSAAPR